MKRKLFLFLLIGLMFSLVSLQPAKAIPVVFELNYEYSGGTPPEGPTPWLTATFDDSLDGTDLVRLTMAATNLKGSEFISGWWFNFTDRLGPLAAGLLDWVSIDTIAVGGSGEIDFSSGSNDYKAGPDGKFDLLFELPTENSISGHKRFTAGEQVIVDLFLVGDRGLVDLSPNDFDFWSERQEALDDKGPFFSAAHVQSIGAKGGSGWIAPNPNPNPVPEPATMLLLGMGLIGLAGFGRKRFKA